jgi:hypothetical protein
MDQALTLVSADEDEMLDLHYSGHCCTAAVAHIKKIAGKRTVRRGLDNLAFRAI